MNQARRPSEQGIAIVIVLVCIFVLSALAAGFAAYMKVEVRLASNSNNETQMQWLGRSGVEMARYVLGQELTIPNQPYDALNQKWAGGDCDTNDALADVSLKDVELGDGKFTVTITDTERKFNINLALGNDAVLQQALILVGVDAAEVPTIISSIQDWIDPRSDSPRVNGAKSEWYQSLDPPYFVKDGPIDDLTELLFVKGITPEIYWGPNSTNHPMPVFKRSTLQSGLLPNQSPVTAGLADIFTPVSSGRINLNTASATTLQMIPGIDANMAAAIIRMRSGPDGVDGTCDDVPLRQPGGQDLINIGLSPQVAQSLGQFCDVRSSTFEVKVDVSLGLSTRSYYALLKRNGPRDVQILTFRWQ